MALVGFSASAIQALTYQNEDYMGSLNKKASGAQCFIMALGLFWDIVTGLPWTPNGVGSLEPRGYCIFLPGAHYLTINSPYGADSSLNILLILLLLLLTLDPPSFHWPHWFSQKYIENTLLTPLWFYHKSTSLLDSGQLNIMVLVWWTPNSQIHESETLYFLWIIWNKTTVVQYF